MKNAKLEEGRPVRDIVDRTFAFAVAVVAFCRAIGRSAGTARPLVNQLMRSGTSVGANVEEAQAAQSRKDFVSKLQIALKEARESAYWLRLMTETGIAPRNETANLTREANELKCILAAIVVNARRNLETTER